MIQTAQTIYSIPDPTMISLTKIYAEKNKYSEFSNKSFLNKFLIFMNLIQRTGISSEKLGITFLIMLKNRALSYYRQICQNSRDIKKLVERFKIYFENMNHRLQKLDK